ncbi:hypothetical protein AAHA92_28050 [Salvia divinorum]|uniref:Uncharacterized protein n=1 Tax=Salvia divinorum TaxID=28513 RepID=A0ABD1G5M1_SALDI
MVECCLVVLLEKGSLELSWWKNKRLSKRVAKRNHETILGSFKLDLYFSFGSFEYHLYQLVLDFLYVTSNCLVNL